MIRKNALGGIGVVVCPQWSISIRRGFLEGHMATVNKNDISQLPLLLNVVPWLSSDLLDLSIPWQLLETFLKSHLVPCLAVYSLSPPVFSGLSSDADWVHSKEDQTLQMWRYTERSLFKSPHTLIPATCESVTSQREFTDVIKSIDLKIGRLSWAIQMCTI